MLRRLPMTYVEWLLVTNNKSMGLLSYLTEVAVLTSLITAQA